MWSIGLKYAAHAAESNDQPPEVPVLFFKTPYTIVGPDDDVLIPRGSTKTDWEVELAVVIGKRTRYLNSLADAARHIARCTLSNDVSERAFQIEQSAVSGPRARRRDLNPLGPALVPVDELAADDLQLRSWSTAKRARTPRRRT